MSQNPISQGQPSPEQGLACLPFRLRVASVDAHRPTWCTGDILSGTVTLGNLVRSQPDGNEALEVLEIVVGATQQTQAEAGATVALRLSGDGPLHPGQLLTSNLEPAREADQLSGTMVWNGPDPLLSGRTYRLRVGPLALAVTVTAIGDPQAPEEPSVPATQGLKPGQVALVGLSTEQPIAFDAFAENPATGRLQICGTDDAGVWGIYEIGSQPQHPRSIVFQRLDVNQAARASRLRQKPCVIWFTGLSGAGKSTIANLVERRLHDLGHHTYLLDGDNVRHGLNKDLGFSDADRIENIRRVAEVARLMVDAGLIALVSFISPFRSERRMARALLQPDEFIEVYVDTPLSVAEARDPKGLYRKARRGELKNFTGLDSPYEPPERPEVRIQTIEGEAQLAADCVVDYLRAHRFLRTPID